MSNRYGLTFISRASVKSVASNFAGNVSGYAPEHWWGATTDMAPYGGANTNSTIFGYRQPIRMSDGVTGWWYYAETGDAGGDQAKVDEQINMIADAGIMAVCVLYYGRIADFQASNNGFPTQVKLWKWFDYYMTSAYKSRLKFAVMPVTPHASFDANSGAQPQYPLIAGTWLNLPAEAAYWATLAQDSQSLKDVNGRTLLYLFDGSGTDWTGTQKTVIDTAFTNAGLLTPTYVLLDKSGADIDTFGGQYSAYGPAGDGISGTQNSYKTLRDVNRTNWRVFTALGAKYQASLTHSLDPQAVYGVGAIAWADRATYSEAEQHIAQTIAYACSAYNHVPDKAILIYSVGEIAEGGDWFPTRQSIVRGVNSPSRGVWLDAWKNVVKGTRPSTFTDHYHATSKHAAITRTGTGWSMVFGVHAGGGSNIAPFDFRQASNVTLNDTLTITPPGNCTRIRLYGTKGPGLGTFNAQKDGGGATLVDQVAGATSHHNLLYDTGALSAASHNVKLTVVTGVLVDEFEVDVSR